jgi:hypothetical protein
MRAKCLFAVVGAVVLAASALGVPTASAAQHTRAISACTKARYAPTHFVFFCADGNAGLKHAAYSRYTATDAHGHGTYYWNDCRPSCAGGTFHHANAFIHLYRVRATDKYGPLFTRIRVATEKQDKVFQLPTTTLNDY